MALKIKTILKCWYLLKRNVVLIAWTMLVCFVFVNTFEYYRTEKKFAHLQNILGVGLYTSRATATVLNICSSLVLFPVCKKFNQLVHRALSNISYRLLVYWLSQAQTCHIKIATTLMIFAVVHTAAHVVNAWNFSRHYDTQHEDINWADYPNQNPLHVLFLTRPGVTGVSLLLILLALAISSTRPVRDRSYNLFWYTHHLFLPFMILLLLHPLSGVLKEQINICEEENSTQRFTFNFTVEQSGEDIQQKVRPIFIPIRSQTWMWISFPFFCYVVDSIYRKLQRNLLAAHVVQVEFLKERAIRMRLNYFTNIFKCKPGQYILLQWPRISNIEWHPFTVCQISNEYDKPSLSVLVSVTGDWTKKLENHLKCHLSSESYSKAEHERPRMLIDGPYASPMENISRCTVAVCVAAGSGITPFAAVLDALLRKPQNLTPHRLHLVWICRTEAQIIWFAELLSQVHKVLWNRNQPDRLDLQLHITSSSWKMSDEFRKSYRLLSCRLHKGRPDWHAVFDYWTYLYPRQDLSVFCCGPNKLTKTIKKYCRIFNGCSTTKIDFYHEAFS